MDEQEHEQGETAAGEPTDAPEEPAEAPEEPQEATEEPDRRGAEDGDPPPPEPPEDEPSSGQPQGLSEKEIEQRFAKLAAEKARHTKRIAEILEEDANDLLVCELCWEPTPGFRFPQMPEEQRSAVMTAIGFSPEPELEEAKDARQCPDCKGWGQVTTGSKVQGFDAMVCMTCNGAGAVGERFEAKAPAEFTAAVQAPGNGPQPAVEDLSDEAIMAMALRTKGFTVIEPYAPAGA